ncbi:MAG: transporter, partial [Spirochaetia bacterium]|nr:transporter [Spirochaetia bacterium]
MFAYTNFFKWVRQSGTLGRLSLLLSFALFLGGAPLFGEGYWLFNPSPKDKLRELATDRPDQTESPISVDGGHLQLEMNFLSFTYDKLGADAGVTEKRSWNFFPFNFKIGLFSFLDFQIVYDSLLQETTVLTGRTDSSFGLGDFTLRAKLNLWGNDGGPTALGLMPWVKLPTATAGGSYFEAGLIAPFSVELPLKFGLGLMTEIDLVQPTGLPTWQWINSVTVSRDIAGPLSAYVEFYSLIPLADTASWQGM